VLAGRSSAGNVKSTGLVPFAIAPANRTIPVAPGDPQGFAHGRAVAPDASRLRRVGVRRVMCDGSNPGPDPLRGRLLRPTPRFSPRHAQELRYWHSCQLAGTALRTPEAATVSSRFFPSGRPFRRRKCVGRAYTTEIASLSKCELRPYPASGTGIASGTKDNLRQEGSNGVNDNLPSA
jgi:hypothetical protein